MKKKLVVGLIVFVIVSIILVVILVEVVMIKVKSGDFLWKLV